MKRTLAALAGAFALVVAGPLAPSTAATPSITPAQVTTGFSGIAYGSYIFNSDKTLTSGPTANSSIGCTGLTGLTSSNSTAALNVPAVGAVGAAATSVRTLETATGKRIESRSVVGSTNLLGGLITAGTISSVSIADKNTAGAFSGINQTNIANLKVLGLSVAANPAPNTVIDLNVPLLGSLGKITLNGQEKKLVNGTFQVSTTALRVEVLKAGIAGVKAGTDIRLGVSLAKLTPPQLGYATGAGFTTKATLATGLLGSGPTAYAALSCGAGTQTVNLAGATVPGLATVGASTTTTTTVVSPAVKGTVTNSLAGLNVLSGVIQADAIKAETSASRAAAGGLVTLTDTSTFTNLRITGLPAINASVAPNTVVQVPGLGKVTLHKVTKTSAAIMVTMVEIVLNQSIGGLPTGSTIQIGYSGTAIRN